MKFSHAKTLSRKVVIKNEDNFATKRLCIFVYIKD